MKRVIGMFMFAVLMSSAFAMAQSVVGTGSSDNSPYAAYTSAHNAYTAAIKAREGAYNSYLAAYKIYSADYYDYNNSNCGTSCSSYLAKMDESKANLELAEKALKDAQKTESEALSLLEIAGANLDASNKGYAVPIASPELPTLPDSDIEMGLVQELPSIDLQKGISNEEKYCSTLSDLSDDRSECYNEVALNQLNYPLCKKVNNLDMRNDCFYEIALERVIGDLCDFISNDELKLKTNCYASVGTMTGDSSLCQRADIANEKYIDSRKDTKYFARLAVGAGLMAAVTPIPMIFAAVGVAGVARGGLNAYGSLIFDPKNVKQIDSCYFTAAKHQGNYQICKFIRDDHLLKDCSSQVLMVASLR